MAVEETVVVPQPAQASPLRSAPLCAYAGAIAAALCLLAVLVAGWGNRSGAWDYRVALTILRWAAWGGLASAIVSTIGGIAAMPGDPPRRVPLFAISGVVLGSLVFAVPWAYQARGREVPPIHDITTDFTSPPRFVDVLPLRKDAPNRTDYEGSGVAGQQLKAYPDIAPAKLAVAPARAFDLAAAAARSLGWDIVAAVPEAGRIEATDTTLFMGFKDDVVIRVMPEGTGARVDIRSVSRVGRNDFGTNAKRVRAFLARLKGP